MSHLIAHIIADAIFAVLLIAEALMIWDLWETYGPLIREALSHPWER